MPTAITETDSYAATIDAPIAGEPRTASSVRVPLGELANRTLFLKTGLDVIDPDRSGVRYLRRAANIGALQAIGPGDRVSRGVVMLDGRGLYEWFPTLTNNPPVEPWTVRPSDISGSDPGRWVCVARTAFERIVVGPNSDATISPATGDIVVLDDSIGAPRAYTLATLGARGGESILFVYDGGEPVTIDGFYKVGRADRGNREWLLCTAKDNGEWLYTGPRPGVHVVTKQSNTVHDLTHLFNTVDFVDVTNVKANDLIDVDAAVVCTLATLPGYTDSTLKAEVRLFFNASASDSAFAGSYLVPPNLFQTTIPIKWTYTVTEDDEATGTVSVFVQARYVCDLSSSLFVAQVRLLSLKAEHRAVNA